VVTKRAVLPVRVLLGLVLVATTMVVTAFTTTSSASAAVDPCGVGGNAIACENSKPGTDPSIWDIDGAGDDDIQGFATDISVNVGGTIQFKIDTSARAYTIDIYRTGWYQGLGARKIASVTPSASLPQKQPSCITDASTEIYDCGNWGVSASWAVPSTAVSGVYFAKLTRTDNGDDSQITFVVRNDSSHSDVLFQTSDPTWQAYNMYGGSDFYHGAANGRAYKLSYNRPVVTRGDNNGRDFYFSAEYAAVRFMERNGYDVSYTSGVDTDRRGALIKNHKIFMSTGHDEYWSAAQRANVEAARDAGVNLMFLSGNEVYWHTRYEASADSSHTAYRTLTSYKETWADEKIDPTPEWTGTWRDPRFAPQSQGAGKPENGLTGTMYMSNNTDLAVTVSAAEGKLRLWRNTSLATMSSGSQALAAHTIGYESDEDLDNGFRPAGLVRLSTTTGPTDQYLQDFGNVVLPGTTTHHLTMYKAPSGALVFSAGTIQWTWGLDATHDGNGAAADPRMQQAQINLFADMGAQPTTLMSGMVAATKSTDTTGPTTTITSPTNGGTVANGTSVTATGTASDAAGKVAGVEVSTDNGATWHPATGTTSWSYTYIQHGQGSVPLKVRAIDDSANIGTAATVTRTVNCPCSVYGAEVPAKPDSGDTSPVEVGLKFTPTADGFVSGVRFYKASGNTGTHVGTVWSSTGQQLAQATFTNETASGWQTVSFTSPVPVSQGSTYVVSYTAPNGHYTAQNGAFWSQGIDATPLKVAGGFGTDPAGVYAGPGQFPTDSFQRGQYYVDPMFTLTDSSPLTVVNQSPLPGSSSVPIGSKISAQFSKPITQSTLAVSVKDANNLTVAGSTAYDATTRTVTFTPTSALSGFVKYSVSVTAKDTTGASVSSGGTWTFTTAKPDPAPGVCPCTLFSDSLTPTTLEAADNSAVTLGVRFSSSVDGTVTGVRFYKGPGNTGTHVGTLWSSTGTQLATATFTGESTAGWQDVTFSQPVSITKNTEYVASYRTTVGHYSVTPNTLDSPTTNGPLSTPSGAGVYTYAAGFPNTRTGTNYLVDVVFQKPPAAIAVAGQSPAPGAVDTDRDDPVKIWFTNAIKSGWSMSVKAGGSAVAGTASLSADGTTLTFNPSSRLPAGTVVSVSVSGITSVDGATLANQNWSFTTTSSTDSTPETLFGAVTPATAAANDSSPVELGVAFSPTLDGKITGVRFFKGTGNGGTHRGTLWSSTGTQLATVTFAGESPTGWQTAKFATPVNVTAGTTYVVSYLAPQGHYAVTGGFFANPWSNAHLTAPAGNNGRYVYGAAGGFPTNDYGATNYFVDVTFVPSTPTITVTDRTPASGATGVDVGVNPSMTFSKPLATGYAISMKAGSTTVPGDSSLSSDGTTLTFDPTSPLAASTTYTVTITGITSTQGATLADQSWSFTTAGATTTESLFTGQTPKTASNNDSASVELGTAFSPTVDGTVNAIKFYKGSGNTGTHVGTIWSSTGTSLATVTFTNETSTGWQTATLSQPLAVTAGQTYVVSYLAPNGHYSSSSAFFANPWTNGHLTAPAGNNGRYSYGTGGFPTDSWNSTNYFVDVSFTAGG
jgi:hypothetical protein